MNRRRKFADELLWLNIVPAANDLPLEADELPETVVENLHIAVMLRGEVTSTRFKIWEREIAKCICPASVGSISMSTTFQLTSTTHALIPEKCAGELFLKWSKLLELPELMDQKRPEGSKSFSKEFGRNVKIVKSDWIVESLKAKKILCSKPYVHSLQLPPPQKAALDAIEQPAQQSRTDITPRITSSPSSSYGPKYRNPEGVKGHPYRGRPGSDGSTKRVLEDPQNPERSEASHANHQTSSSSNKGEKVVYDVIIPTNKNTHITDILKQMVVFYDLIGDNFREMVYNRCCGVLETYHKKIEDVAEVTKLPGVGKSLRDKISEILKTGKLEKLELFKKDVHLSAVVDLGRIWGMGPKGAQNLYNLGYRCVGDVKDRGLDVLTPQQRIGIARFDDLQVRIPRDEVKEIERIVRECAESLVPGIQCVTCGSYRRGSNTCGDVDMLMAPPEGKEHVDILPSLVKHLSDIGFLTDHLAMPNHTHVQTGAGNKISKGVDRTAEKDRDKERRETASASDIEEADNAHSGRSSYMGICRLPGEGNLYRRIDLKSYRRSQFPFAILYFTGPDHFNRAIRNHASLLGYSLSDIGLVQCLRGLKRERIATSTITVPCLSEAEVFTALGLAYKDPDMRCFFLSPVTSKQSAQADG